MMMTPIRTILTLDAGGTNLVFSAVRDGRQVAEQVVLPTVSDHLEECLKVIVDGFEMVMEQLPFGVDAISFAFPGPADYEAGIIGNLPNFPAFNGDVPLKAILEQHFDLPVYINNDGNLFAMGEASFGVLQEINGLLVKSGSTKQFRNLIGITLGTGFGCGIMINGSLVTGDNSCAGEIHNTLNALQPMWNAEESVSARAILREYPEQTKGLMPDDIYEIAMGRSSKNTKRALKSFDLFGKALGHSIVNVATLIDGLVVLGGGLVRGYELFYPAMWEVIRGHYISPSGKRHLRLSYPCYDLDNPVELNLFLAGEIREIAVPGSNRKIRYDCQSRSGIIRSRMGASNAVFQGAYAFAQQRMG